jgi:chorismate synthase
MQANSTGEIFSLSTFGESHGPCIGGLIDGCPPSLNLDMDFIKTELARRRPGQSKLVSQRQESEDFEILSGLMDGKTTGAPIAFIIRNTNQKSEDYETFKNLYRPSHADYTYQKKYGIRDFRGGGRASARETAARVFGGAIAKMILKEENIFVSAYVSAVGEISLNKSYHELDLSLTESNDVRCPDAGKAEEMTKKILEVRKEGDSIGGIVSCVIRGVPAGLGEPVFDKLHAELGKAMLSIHAVKGFEYGSGFAGTRMKGSEHNDIFYRDDDKRIRTRTNYSGGIQGGISNGEDIYFNVAFKAVATIVKNQMTVDVEGNEIEFGGRGRHDPCVLPRAVPVVEAMAALCLTDHLLRYRIYKK